MVISSVPQKYSEVLQTKNRGKHLKGLRNTASTKTNEIRVNDKNTVKEERNKQIIINEEA